MSDFKILNGFYVKDEKARPVNSVSEMKAISNLVSGNIIRTVGYYSANDGGRSYLYNKRKTRNRR